MTVENYAPGAAIIINTAGPHRIPFAYEAGAVRATVQKGLDFTDLVFGADFTVSPSASEGAGGSLILKDTVLTAYFGAKLWITRETTPQQYWQALTEGRETALENQLDRQMMLLQEMRGALRKTLRWPVDLPVFQPAANRLLATDANGLPIAGPDTESVMQAAALAEAARIFIEASVSEAVPAVTFSYVSDGSTRTFPLAAFVADNSQVDLAFDGTVQARDSYTVSEDSFTIAEAPPPGVRIWGRAFIGRTIAQAAANMVVLNNGRTLQQFVDEDAITRDGEETLAGKTLVNPIIAGQSGAEVMRPMDDRVAIRQPLSMNDNFFNQWTFASRAAFEATNVPGWVMSWTILQGSRPVKFRRDQSAAYPAITSVNGVKGMPHDLYTPLHWGAVGDGVTNDGPAFNAALAAYKAAVEAVQDQAGALVFTGLGLQYRTTQSLNYTGVSTWGSCLRDMTIFGACTGKAVLDCIGSRGGLMDHVVIVGDETNRPSTGIQFARAAAGGQEGFCDNWQLSNVHTRGYFTTAGGYFYGQETTTYSHCSFWNSDYTAYAAIHSGYDIAPMASDYLAPITGATSCINDKYLNCDYRFYPDGQTVAVTGISKAASAVITAPGHPFTVGDTVVVGYIGAGMIEANGTRATITAATSSTITLGGVDSTGWTTYTAGGVVVRAQTKPTVLFSRGSQHVFDCCYAVNYGSNHVEFAFPDGFTPFDIRFDLLCEGTGNTSCLRFTAGTNARAVRGFAFRTYAAHVNDAILSTDATGAGQVTLSEVSIASVSTSNGETPAMFAPEGEFALIGGTVTAYAAASINPAAFVQFRASLHTIDNMTVRRLGERIEAAQLGHVTGRGIGGTVAQATSKVTGVTLNKRSGLITMHNSELGSLGSAMFRLTNDQIGATSLVVANVASGASNYRAEVIRTSPGLCDIRVTNLSGGPLSDAVQVRFLVLEGADD